MYRLWPFWAQLFKMFVSVRLIINTFGALTFIQCSPTHPHLKPSIKHSKIFISHFLTYLHNGICRNSHEQRSSKETRTQSAK